MATAGPATFELAPARLCLDFANTVAWRGRPAPEDRLPRYGDLVAWARQAGIVSEGEARRLLEGARRGPGRARAALGAARRLREAIWRVIAAIARRRPPSRADLEIVNRAANAALTRARVVPRGSGFAWAWAGAGAALDRMLWPVARSAAGLLTSDELGAVRECGAPECGWLFVDTSRNRTRRWCDMQSCGNRAKARRYYARRRARRARSAGGKS